MKTKILTISIIAILLISGILGASALLNSRPDAVGQGKIFKVSDLAELSYPVEGRNVKLHAGLSKDGGQSVALQNILAIGDVNGDSERDYIGVLSDNDGHTTHLYLTGVLSATEGVNVLPSFDLGTDIIPHSLIVTDAQKITLEYYSLPKTKLVKLRNFAIQNGAFVEISSL